MQIPITQLKRQLAVRFSDVADSQTALAMLRTIKQKPGENIQIYAERILSLAEEAYDNQGGDVIDRHLIDIFAGGLANDHLLKNKVRNEERNENFKRSTCYNARCSWFSN